MKTVEQLKEELEMNGNLTELMDVLKGVAAAEFWTLSKKRKRFTSFTEAFAMFFQFIEFINVQHPFVKGEGDLGIIMVTSNEGFMGGLNARVINSALMYKGTKDAHLIMIGEQGGAYLESVGLKYTGFPGVASGECYDAALNFKDYIMKEGLSGKFGRLALFYPRPLSFMVQKIEKLDLLPCNAIFEQESEKIKDLENVIVESSVDKIVEYLVETWIIQKLFEIFEDSKLAEFSARTLHLEESYQTLVEQEKKLHHQYFRGRHELVDAEMRDIYSAQIVRKKAKLKKKQKMNMDM